ncbi:MAG: APC family permease [Spirochaetes bacterium]|nr:APC family permease [Spirochaetota bacterium]
MIGIPAGRRPLPDGPVGLLRTLGLWDLVAMNVVAVVALRWIPRAARLGAPSITLWVLAWLTFFLPLAATVCELSSRYPDQGGIYVWIRRAFGPTHGFVCGWCVWVNNLFFFPSLLLFAAPNALLIFGDRFRHLIDSPLYSTLFVIGALWAIVGLNIVGLSIAKWLQNIGSLATWLTAILVVGFGVMALASFGSATSFAPRELLPRGTSWTTVSMWSAICLAFSGFEITPFVGQEIRDPRRTIPRGVLLAGLVITFIYVAGSVGVLVAVPASTLSERSGISDAIQLTSQRVGVGGLGELSAGLLAIGALAMTSSWFAGAARVPFAAGVDGVLPASFGRLHPRFGTPSLGLLVQGGVSSLIFLITIGLTCRSASAPVQEAYDILVGLTILIYFVPYLYLFPSLVRLRARDERPSTETTAAQKRDSRQLRSQVARVPGGRIGLWSVAISGFLTTVMSLSLVFVPPPEARWLNYEANLAGQAAIVIGLGLVVLWHSRRSRASHSVDGVSTILSGK